MDIDALASEFGSTQAAPMASTPDTSGIDVGSLVSEFGSKTSADKFPAKSDEGVTRVYITPKPPISGATDEQSAAINAVPSKTDVPNDNTTPANAGRDLVDWAKNLGPNLKKSTGEALDSSKELAGSGVDDIARGNIPLGALKVAGGALGAVTSPVTGGLKELVEKPVTTFTGNPDIGDRASFAAGAAIPVVPGGNAVVKAIPSNKAFKTLVESIGPENVGTVAQRMRENPRLTPADLSPQVQQDVQKLFVTDGGNTNYLANTTKARVEGAKGAVEGAMNSSLGNTVDVVQKLKDMKQSARDVGQQQINPVVKSAGPVDLSPVIKNIDAQLKPGVSSVISSGQLPDIGIKKDLAGLKQILTDGKSVRINADELHNFQSVLRSKAEDYLASPNGKDRQTGHALMKVRNDVVDAIDAASEGKYKPSLSNYRDEMHIQKAFDHGHDSILASGKSYETRPEFFKEWVSTAKPAELEAAKEGARVAIDTQINGFKEAARQGTDIGKVEFKKQKIEALFGKKEADELFKKLQDERTIADTNSKLTQGSMTAMRSASKAKFELPTAGEGIKALVPPAIVEGASMLSGAPGGLATAAYSAVRGAQYLKDKSSLALAKAHNSNYAKLALPVEGPSRDQLIKDLEAVASKPKKSLLSRANSLGWLVGP